MNARQPRDHAADVTLIIADRDTSVHMRNHVVPRRDLLLELDLARIPVRRDVGIRGAEDDQNLITGGEILSNRVRTSYMRMKHALLTFVRMQFERNMIRVESTLPVRKEDAERIIFNEIV